MTGYAMAPPGGQLSKHKLPLNIDDFKETARVFHTFSTVESSLGGDVLRLCVARATEKRQRDKEEQSVAHGRRHLASLS